MCRDGLFTLCNDLFYKTDIDLSVYLCTEGLIIKFVNSVLFYIVGPIYMHVERVCEIK